MGKWERLRFNDIFVDVTSKATKIPKENYLEQGKFQIIDQGKGDIAGYTNEHSGLFTETPAIVFGDHTRILKYVEEPLFIGADGVKLLRSKLIDVSYRYLYHVLCSVKIENTGYNRHFKWLKESEIPLPPLDQQKRIAKNLDLASEIVKGYKEQLAELDKLVQSVFYEMFGDPSKNEKGLPLVRLCDCLHSIENGKSIICNGVPRFGNNPAILKLSAVTDGFYCESENKAMIGNNGFVESVEVKKGDLLFTRKNTPELVGMSAYVYNTTSKLMMPDLIFRLNTNDSCNKIFLWKLINHDLFRCKIMSLASGSAKSMSNISKARLNQLLIPLPPRKIQNHFAEFVTEIETQKAQVQQALTEAENFFNSLMQEYFE